MEAKETFDYIYWSIIMLFFCIFFFKNCLHFNNAISLAYFKPFLPIQPTINQCATCHTGPHTGYHTQSASQSNYQKKENHTISPICTILTAM